MLGVVRHGLHGLTSGIMSALGAKTFAQLVPVVPTVTEVTPGAVQVIEVDATMFPGAAGTIAIGGPASTEDGGYEAAVSAGFAVLGTGVASVADFLAVDNEVVNRVDIYDAATGEPVETPLGEQVFGLLQAQAAVVDGDAIAAAGVENLQVSFVYLPRANPALANMTLFTMTAATLYRMGFRRHRLLHTMSYASFVVGGDPMPDVLTGVYDIPTFVAVNPADYPVGALLIAGNTQEARIAEAAGWRFIRGSVQALVGAAADTTIDDDDGFETILVDCAGADRTLVLPPLATNIGRKIAVVKIDAGADLVTLDGNGAETIAGALSQILRQRWARFVVQATTAGWVLLEGEADPGAILLHTLNSWAGGPLGGPLGGAVGYLGSMDFAAGGGEDVIGYFRLGEDFIPGRDLELEFDYSSDAAAASNALFSTSSALYRVGTETDIAAPANLNADAAVVVPESAPVDEITTSPRFEITDGAGDINGITPAVGNLIAVLLERDVGDPSAGVFRVYTEMRVYMREA